MVICQWIPAAHHTIPQGGGRKICGGAKGIRTPDLLRAKQMLYQLSYRPKTRENREWRGIPYSLVVGGRRWTRTTSLNLIRIAL
jgi:hypothetical protein